jgi:hypothetical protein
VLWSATSTAALLLKSGSGRAADHDGRRSRRTAAQVDARSGGAVRDPREDRPRSPKRAGLIATQVHQIVPTTDDPLMRFFEGAFSDTNNWEENPPQPAIDGRVIDRTEPDVEPEEIARAAQC